MFKTARLKLTAWYLLIIMTISLSFSVFIYRIIALEFQRRLNTIERRLELRRFGFFPPSGQSHFFIEDIKETREELLFILIYTNGTIFFFSALAGYFLAGKTLLPIEKALEEQKRFVADASHELKTPLTSLQTSIEVGLRDKKLNLKNAKKTLFESLDDIEKLKTLTNNLLTLAKYQQNGINLLKEEFEIKEIIKKIKREFIPLSREKNIKLKISAFDFKCIASRESVEKLLTVLLDNALKYTLKNGRVFLSLKKERKCLLMEVADTGVGIDKKHLPHIFDRFYRIDSSRSKTDDSSFGLGLAMAKIIVEINKGSISVKSQVGKGSTFTVKLPIG